MDLWTIAFTACKAGVCITTWHSCGFLSQDKCERVARVMVEEGNKDHFYDKPPVALVVHDRDEEARWRALILEH